MNHALFHESNRRPAVNEAPTEGLRSRKGGRPMTSPTNVPLATTSEEEAVATGTRPPGHYDTVRALRAWGHSELADDLLTVITDHCLDNQRTLAHYQWLLDEAMAS